MERPSRRFGAAPRSCCVRQVCVNHQLPREIDTHRDIVFQPSFASLSNIFGRRPIVLIALVLFCVGAIVAAIAKDFTYMLVGRSVQGVGGGGIIALSEVIITDLIPLRWRGQYFGILSAMWSVGSVTGPILGGGFAENVTWVCDTTSSGLPKLTLLPPAMDFLHQLPFYWNRRGFCHSLLETRRRSQFAGRETAPHRLCRHRPIRRQSVVILDPSDVGWCLVCLEFMADAGSTDCRRRGPSRVQLL